LILVLLGTQNNSFERLLKEIDKLIDEGIIKDEVIVQAGFTKYESKNMKIYDLIAKDELNKYISKSSLVITHGGVGSITSSIEQNKKVIAVPRLHIYKEHVNDHQLDIIDNFSKNGYIIGIKDVSELKSALKKVKTFKPKPYVHDNSKMLKIIEDYINTI